MFAHLHCHSYFSMMRGTLSIERLCQMAAECGMNSLALTDVGGLYGWVEFVQTCEQYGLRPICGVELSVGESSAVLLAKDLKGYERICRITSELHLNGQMETKTTGPEDGSCHRARFGGAVAPAKRNPVPPILRDLMCNRSHLTILSRDTEFLRQLRKKTGPEDLYVEILPGEENFSRLQFVRETGVTPLATNDVYFGDPREWHAYRMLRAIDENTTLSRLDLTSSPPAPLPGEERKELVSPRRYFCDEAALRQNLSYAPEAVDNAARLAESLQTVWPLGTTVFPPYEAFHDAEAYFQLRWKCYQGALRRYGSLTPKISSRLDYELKVIRQKGFCHYFLVVDDIVRQAPRTCGRGSVAASLVSYCLGITHVDPIAHNLMFERFLNPGRKDPPDADIDFPWDERDDILDYIFEKYNDEAQNQYRAAMVCNHVRLQTRALLREVAKVHGLPDSEIKIMSERLRRFPPKEYPKPWDSIVRWTQALDDFPRYLSVHCGGVVIVPDDLRRYVPMERAPKGVNIIQWEKDQTEDFGLVKIDILGNRSLAVIRDAIGEVRQHGGEKISYETLNPLEDEATQAMLQRGETMGVFYVESPATRQLQQKAGVGDYEHLVIHSSIIRPAAHRFINEYVERLHGKPYDPVHPALAEALRETFGIMVYQEDVTKTAMAIAGFDAVEADGLRKALSKKRPEKKLSAYRERFFAGALQRGVDSAVIERIWEMILSFAGYSFCKPHSASYALVSFQSAYLRAHYPAEFMAAVLSNGGGYYSTFAYLSEARRMGLKVLPPDINASAITYTGEKEALQVGLMQLKGVQEKSLEAIMTARESGPFTSLEDFLERVKVDLSDVKILIRAGCFDSIAGDCHRAQLIWKLLQMHSVPDRRWNFSFRSRKPWIPSLGDYSEREKLEDEQEIFGFPLSCHPLSLYADELANISTLPAEAMASAVGKRVQMVGWLISSKVVWTHEDNPMAFMSFEDETSIYETVFFPKSYERFAPRINAREPFLLTGILEEDHGAISLHVHGVQALSTCQSQSPYAREALRL